MGSRMRDALSCKYLKIFRKTLASRIEHKCEPQSKSSPYKRTVLFFTAYGAMSRNRPVWIGSRPVEWEPPAGSYKSCKSAPYGFSQLSEWHVPNSVEQQTIRVVQECRQAGLSLPKICRELQSMEIEPRHGKVWQVSTVHKILKNQLGIDGKVASLSP